MATKRKTKTAPKSKSKPATKAKPAVTAHEIEVAVDKKGKFTYTLKGGGDATSLITRRQGDTISWSVRYKGKRVAFQVEFTAEGPFGFDSRVIRSTGKDSTPLTVNVPDSYQGNYVMEYRVTIENGWSDDPDVVPILSDGSSGLVAPAIVTIADDGHGGLTITPPSTSTSVNSPVLWKWAGTPKGEFHLAFENPPMQWRKETDSVAQQVALTFPVAAKDQGYTIKVANNALVGAGKLTVTG